MIAADGSRVLVLDDDPTGSQAASDVTVLLGHFPDLIREWLTGSDRGLYLVTNTRSLPVAQAVAVLQRIRATVEELCRETGERVAYVLRGDSTLRGHVFEEVAVFTPPGGVVLFCPAFPEGGRVTIGGVHYLRGPAGPQPVSDTEFARDPVFGFASRTLAGWVQEKGQSGAPTHVPLEALRDGGAQAVADALLSAPAGAVVIPDAEDAMDIAAITVGLLMAQRAGRSVTVRSAATLAALRMGTQPKHLVNIPAGGGRVLVVCGSHTELSTRQLKRLTDSTGPAVVLGTDTALEGSTSHALVADELRSLLNSSGVAVLATERDRRPEHSQLHHGAAVMAALTAVVAMLGSDVDACIVKGGISSADIAVHGFGIRRARVLGQLEPGVAVWRAEAGGRELPYVVVPGNVGNDDTIHRALTAIRPAGSGPVARSSSAAPHSRR